MKSFLRENPTIAFGLGLPLLLVVVFLLISGIPTLLVAPPQYDVLYATEYYGSQNDIQISVVDQKVQVIYQGSLQSGQKPRIWRYDPKTGGVREIAIILPPDPAPAEKEPDSSGKAAKSIMIDVPDLEGVTVDSSSVAPDGYEFSIGSDRYSRNVFSGLFYSSRYQNEAVLTKNGRSIPLPNSTDQYYSYNTRLIGWVVPL